MVSQNRLPNDNSETNKIKPFWMLLSINKKTQNIIITSFGKSREYVMNNKYRVPKDYSYEAFDLSNNSTPASMKKWLIDNGMTEENAAITLIGIASHIFSITVPSNS